MMDGTGHKGENVRELRRWRKGSHVGRGWARARATKDKGKGKGRGGGGKGEGGGEVEGKSKKGVGEEENEKERRRGEGGGIYHVCVVVHVLSNVLRDRATKMVECTN